MPPIQPRFKPLSGSAAPFGFSLIPKRSRFNMEPRLNVPSISKSLSLSLSAFSYLNRNFEKLQDSLFLFVFFFFFFSLTFLSLSCGPNSNKRAHLGMDTDDVVEVAPPFSCSRKLRKNKEVPSLFLFFVSLSIFSIAKIKVSIFLFPLEFDRTRSCGCGEISDLWKLIAMFSRSSYCF